MFARVRASNMRVQFNARINTSLKDLVDADGAKMKTTAEVIAEVALKNLFQLKPKERQRLYEAHDRPPYSRK